MSSGSLKPATASLHSQKINYRGICSPHIKVIKQRKQEMNYTVNANAIVVTENKDVQCAHHTTFNVCIKDTYIIIYD